MARPFENFVVAVHRRAVAVRWLERVGLCLAGGAAVAIALSFAASGRAAVWPMVWIVAIAAVAVGAAWGIVTRPSRLDAVAEADRQLDLSDLLSTALLAAPDDFGQAVRAMADRATATRSPSQVLLNRLGVRFWGGIGLAWAMVGVVAAMLAGRSPSPVDAGDTAPSLLNPPPPIARQIAPRTAPAVGEHVLQSPDPSARTADNASNANRSNSNPGDSATPGDTSGGGSASTPNTAAPTVTQSPGSTEPSDDGQASAGVGRSTANAANADAGGTASIERRAAAPWSSDRWPADRAAAMQAVEQGQIPDAYRPLVRDYFNHQ